MRFKSLGLLGAGVLLALRAGAVSGQADATAFQDSLSFLTAMQLRGVLQGVGGAETAERLLRSGLAALRLFELERDPSDADVSRKLLERAVERAPGWAWAHYGLGAALARGPELRPGGVLRGVVTVQAFAEIFGADPAARAYRSLRKAIELDPLMVPALVELSELALHTGEEAQLHEARGALFSASAAAPDRRIWLALSRVESALGMGSAAQHAAEQLVRLDSTNAIARHALARGLFAQEGKAQAAAAVYLSGLALMDSAAAELYYRDASYILTADEARAWRWLAQADRVAWLRRLWEVRAARAGVTVTERLAEHYRRLAEAERAYRRTAEFGAPPIGSLVLDGLADAPFDDRGVLLVRHGRPHDVVSTISNGFPPNQTWVYERPDTAGYRLFNFLKYPGTADYRLIVQLPPCDSSGHALQDPAVRMGLVPRFDARWVEGAIRYYEDRGKYDPEYQQLASHCQASTLRRTGRPTLMDAVTVRHDALELGMTLQREALAALNSDSHQPDFEVNVPFIHRVYTFRGAANDAELTAALLVPGDRITPARATGGQHIYRLGVTLILIDSAAERVTRMDTTMTFESGRVLAREDFLRLHVTLNAALGSAVTYRVVLRDEGGVRRGGMAVGRVAAQQLASPNPELSDLVIAESDSGRWRRGAVGLALLPPHEIDADRAFVLFYEIYNLPPGSAYAAEVSFEPIKSGVLSGLRGLFGGKPGRVRLRFDGTTSAAPVSQVTHRITSELPPGEYRLRVSVSDLRNEQRTERETRLVILPVKTGGRR